MSRVIRPDSPSRLRTALLDSIRATLPALATTGSEAQLRDRLAFILLVLRQVQASIEPTAEAWERRSYWVKADQFRRGWTWAATIADSLFGALMTGDLVAARQLAMTIEPHLPPSRATKRRDLSGLWAGSFQRLKDAQAPSAPAAGGLAQGRNVQNNGSRPAGKGGDRKPNA